jgi:uncharacterized membrane protein (UPF0127 family)
VTPRSSRSKLSAAAAVAAVAFACGAAGGKASAPEPASLPRTNVHHTDENWVGPPLPRAQVILTDAYGGRHAVDAEVAGTPEMRERGLMWRKQLAEGKGMLFVFPIEEEHSFWMRNTLIPLDMLFIDTDGLIVGIEENTPTMSDDTFEVGCPSRYVLEVNAGWTRAHGVFAGQSVKIEGL